MLFVQSILQFQEVSVVLTPRNAAKKRMKKETSKRVTGRWFWELPGNNGKVKRAQSRDGIGKIKMVKTRKVVSRPSCGRCSCQVSPKIAKAGQGAMELQAKSGDYAARRMRLVVVGKL